MTRRSCLPDVQVWIVPPLLDRRLELGESMDGQWTVKRASLQLSGWNKITRSICVCKQYDGKQLRLYVVSPLWYIRRADINVCALNLASASRTREYAGRGRA
jgi:hypothetical protein